MAAGVAHTLVARAPPVRPSTRQGCGESWLAGRVQVLLEHPSFVPRDASLIVPGATVVAADLADGSGGWAAALRGADSLVHFSAVNPYPNASWEVWLPAPQCRPDRPITAAVCPWAAATHQPAVYPPPPCRDPPPPCMLP